jgi:hypothetical protein
MANDSEISVKIGADVSEFEDGANQASETADQLTQKLEGIAGVAGTDGLDATGEAASRLGVNLQAASESANAFGSSLSTMGEVAAGVLAGINLEDIAGEFKDFLEDATFGTFEFAESIKNQSISTGIATDTLQALQYAFNTVGVSATHLQQQVNSVARAMTEFADGSKRATDAAATLGLDPSKWTSVNDAFIQIGERYKELTADGQQLSLANEAAFQVFLGGRFGMQSLAALERLPELEEQARAAGVIMGSDTLEASDKAAEAIHRLSAEWGALEHAIGGALAPLATLAAEGIGERLFGLQPPEGGGVAGETGGGPAQYASRGAPNQPLSPEMPAETLQPAVDGQQTLKTAIDSTTGSIDMQTAAMKDPAAIAPETMDQIRDKAEAADAAWQQMNQDMEDGAATVLSHVEEKWAELDAAEQQAKQDLRDTASEIADVLAPIGSDFDKLVDEMLSSTHSKTETMKQDWSNLAQSITESLIKSGLKDLLVGGKEGSIGGAISTAITGQGGGLAGETRESV